MSTDQQTASAPCTDVVKEHIRRVLEDRLRCNNARFDRMDELEQSGHRIITGGQISGDEWEIRDWNTGEVIAKGGDGVDGLDAAAARLDPDEKWFHEDHITEGYDSELVTTPGIPPGLGEAIEEWVSQTATSDEEIADFIGWPVEKVREHR